MRIRAFVSSLGLGLGTLLIAGAAGSGPAIAAPCNYLSAPSGTITANPATPTVGDPVTFTADIHNPGNAAYGGTYVWDFGDGTTQMGNPATHVFTSAGSRHVTVTVSNCTDDAHTARPYLDLNVLPPLTLMDLHISPSHFRPSPGTYRGNPGRGVGTNVTYAVSAAANVDFRIERVTTGTLVNGTCQRQRRPHRGGTRCQLLDFVAPFLRSSTEGPNHFIFGGSTNRHKLPEGAYLLQANATDARGRTSGYATSNTFHIVR
jgi:uncharacterized repeat protein (TIGR01451 family)